MSKTIEEAIREAGVSDDDAPSYKHFVGYLGGSSAAGRTRLYLNEQLNEYIEVSTDLATVIDLGNPNSPLVLLLIKTKVEIEHVVRLSDRMFVSEQTQSDFLAGEIADRYLDQIGTINPPPPPRPGPLSVGGRCMPRTPWFSW